MAARINYSIQNTLSLLNPLCSSISARSTTTAHFKNRLSFPTKLLLLNSKAAFCTVANSNPNSAQNGEAVAAETFVLTTPLYYVNAPPHMGSAYTTIAADAIARFQRLLGKKVIFVTGTDEHGEKIATAAAALALAQLEIAYDKFIRTTDPKHEAIVKEFYSRVLANGDIYRADYEGLYCVSCEEYKVQSWIKCGLKDFSISRASVDWGIPVPNDNKQTIYVWFDALLGYLSALSEDKEQTNLQSAVSSGWPASLHLIGKDILRFHAVYWPAMLMSAGLGLPKVVFGHGFLTKDGLKMGKSLGNTLEPNELVQKFGSDAVRYFFLREVEFGNDGDYSEERFVNIVNAHLANTIGNLLNRTLGLLKKNCQSTLVVDSAIAAEGNALKDTVEKLVEKARIHYANLSLSLACETILEIGSRDYIGGNEDYSNCFVPVAPSLCWRIYAQLGYSKDHFNTVTWSETKWGGLKGGQLMAQPKPVFARIENRTETEDSEAASKKFVKNKEKNPKSQVVAEA
ncbi:hypothetical protein GH714_010287 [Hevea brasiliensis]|uniref:methionine--tRNA ligase n=1 Tax=Hevea brasiliensis TaxID=3981 RepID=A0A6A6N242_HEVBR|nr:hypothetical protein GH714_010287 [Hevea brasiliensis]